MSSTTRISFIPAPGGLTAVLHESALRSVVKQAADAIAQRATGNVQGSAGFTVSIKDEPRFQDARYGATRPVAYIEPADDAARLAESENKILTKAVSG